MSQSEDDTWTVGRALGWVQGYLERKGDASPRVSAEWLVSEVCALRRIDLYLNLDRPLERVELDLLHDYVLRRGKGEPLQYIVGEAPFRYISVKVRPGVLIPRPETEVLVSEALACLPAARKRVGRWSADAAEREAAAVEQLKERVRKTLEEQGEGPDAAKLSGFGMKDALSGDTMLRLDASDANVGEGLPLGEGDARLPDAADPFFLVADICTGSGCIACSIASERPDTRVIATDIASEAVALARDNVQALGLADAVKVLQGDLGQSIPERYLGRFDLVVSNPPYVPSPVLATLPGEVSQFEPALALDGGDDGLDVFRKLAVWARAALKTGGAFACELHETCLEEASQIAAEAGFPTVRIVRDLADRPRVLVCSL